MMSFRVGICTCRAHHLKLRASRVAKLVFRSQSAVVSFDTVLSDSNKGRVQEKLVGLHPERTVPAWAKKRVMRKAAVLVPLCRINGEPSVLFTLRSTDLSHHKGEVSFPGGLRDDTDSSYTHTALRETHEELRIPPEKVDVWGEMPPVPGKEYKTLVTPVVGHLGDVNLDQIDFSRNEVSEVFARSLRSLCASPVRKVYPGRDVAMPEFPGGEHRIWGVTAVILHETLRVIAPGIYTFEMKYFVKKVELQ